MVILSSLFRTVRRWFSWIWEKGFKSYSYSKDTLWVPLKTKARAFVLRREETPEEVWVPFGAMGAFSGSQTTALTVMATPGMPQSFLAKTEAEVAGAGDSFQIFIPYAVIRSIKTTNGHM